MCSLGLQPGFWPGQAPVQGPGRGPLKAGSGTSILLPVTQHWLREEIRGTPQYDVLLWMVGTCLGRVAGPQTHRGGSSRGKDQRLWDPRHET